MDDSATFESSADSKTDSDSSYIPDPSQSPVSATQPRAKRTLSPQIDAQKGESDGIESPFCTSPPRLKRARTRSISQQYTEFCPCTDLAESIFMKEYCTPAEPPAPITDELTNTNTTEKYLALSAVRSALLANKNTLTTSGPFVNEALHKCNLEIKDLVYTARREYARKYAELLQLSSPAVSSEIDYFMHKLSAKEQTDTISRIKHIQKEMPSDIPYRLRIIQADMPNQFKIAGIQKLAMMDAMNPSDSEYFKLAAWIDAFMRIPFGIYRGLSISVADGADACRAYLENAQDTLNKCVFGLADAKMQIMQMLGRWVSNPAALGGAVAIHGPMGTGKTSIVKNGISKILGRDFVFISLGGASGASTLDGHSYTYEGSTYGKIVQSLMAAGSMNPVFYFDELDKISDSPRGEEIASLLIHLTDPVQNSHFRDNYFVDVELDVSKCLFIFSYNDETKISPVLRDRMYNIRTAGYSAADKRAITRIHLLPRICEQLNMAETEVAITDCAIDYITNNPALSKNEAGVRNLQRCLEFVHAKLNLQKLMEHRTFSSVNTDIATSDLAMPETGPKVVNAAVAAVLLADMARGETTSAMHSMYV